MSQPSAGETTGGTVSMKGAMPLYDAARGFVGASTGVSLATAVMGAQSSGPTTVAARAHPVRCRQVCASCAFPSCIASSSAAWAIAPRAKGPA
jgi:hypothetical protein